MTTKIRWPVRQKTGSGMQPAGRPRLLLCVPGVAGPVLAVLAAAMTLALGWGGYYLLGLAVMPALGLALAIRSTAQGGRHSSTLRRRMTRRDLTLDTLLVVSAAGLVGLGLVALLWR
jgi:hypothetical protein